MGFKGRLKELYEFIGPTTNPVYDLFCDHGQLGARFLQDGSCRVTFNDKRKHLVDNLRLKYKEHEHAFYEVCDAKDIKFVENSTVVMAGVGGLTMISCFEAWLETHNADYFSSLEFIISPHYYGFELRYYLFTKGFSYKSEAFIEEGRYVYEVARVERAQVLSPRVFFDKLKWLSFGEKGRKYLSFTYRNLSNKSVLSSWEVELLDNITELIK